MSDGNEKLYNFAKRSEEFAIGDFGPSKTVQSDMVDADINVIVARYGITGTVPQNVRLPMTEDYDEVFDFHTAQQRIAEATQEFMRLPADIRAEFNNDPGVFYDIASNPDNIEYLYELGLATRPEPTPKPDPVEVRVIADAPPA